MIKKFTDAFTPVSSVLVSSNVGQNQKLRKLHEQMTYELMKAKERYFIRDSNGMDFGLTDLQQKIVEAADAYVFLPIPEHIKQPTAPVNRDFFREMFKAASLFVGAQTADPELHLEKPNGHSERTLDAPLKPIILVNSDKKSRCWKPFVELAEHMHALGTIKQKPENIIHMVDDIGSAMELLATAHRKKLKAAPTHAGSHHALPKRQREQDTHEERIPDFNVCVFCSASTKNHELKESARQLGADIARQGWGLISGLGRTGMMGTVVEGAAEVIKNEGKGWVGGSNLPRIIKMEGLPDYYDKFWEKPDIYTRMEVMIEKSQAFVVMPGGMGTVQELMALLLLKHAKENGKPYLMRDDKFANKPIILVNHEVDHDGKRVKFWKPLVDMAKKFGFEDDIIVVDSIDQAMQQLENHHRSHQLPRKIRNLSR